MVIPEKQRTFRTHYKETDIFNLKPPKEVNTSNPIRKYNNQSSISSTEPHTEKIRPKKYLESDILFRKECKVEENKVIYGAKRNEESKIEQNKIEKRRQNLGKEFLRTYEEIDPMGRKNMKYKNEPNPDNGLAFDFSNNAGKIKTGKKILPEKISETVPKIQRGKKIYGIKNNEDPGSSLKKKE
jgi:hypothetical protein